MTTKHRKIQLEREAACLRLLEKAIQDSQHSYEMSSQIDVIGLAADILDSIRAQGWMLAKRANQPKP